MGHGDDDLDAAAIGWVLRTREPDFIAWEAFAAWLEADPRHAALYHQLQADADALAEVIPVPAIPAAEPAFPVRIDHARPNRRRWLAGAVAAALVGVVGYSALDMTPHVYVVETAPGITRTLRLGDGSSIALNGGTRLTLDRKDERWAVLDRGEALFTVRHDAARPFRIRVGDDELVDVGTVFDVVRSDGKTWVGVAEGAILFNPRQEAVEVTAGHGLSSSDGDNMVQVVDIAAGSVGDWAQGRLDFAGTPLDEVAAALSRALGTRVTVTPALAARPFRGTIALADIRRDPGRLAALLDVRILPTASGWEITAAP